MQPESYRVLLTPKVVAQLKEIRDHIAQAAPDTAADVVARILEACYGLEVLPHRYQRRRSRKVPDVVRQMPVLGAYRVLYAVDDAVRTVTVHGVQHGSRSRWY